MTNTVSKPNPEGGLTPTSLDGPPLGVATLDLSVRLNSFPRRKFPLERQSNAFQEKLRRGRVLKRSGVGPREVKKFFLLPVLDGIRSHLCTEAVPSGDTERFALVVDWARAGIGHLDPYFLQLMFVQTDRSVVKWELRGVSAEAALSFTLSWLEIILDHYEFVTRLSWETLLSCYLESRDWPPDKFMKYAKWTKDSLFALYIGNEPEEAPSNSLRHIPFDGKLRQHLKNVLHCKTKKNLHFWNSILQGLKRGCLPPSEEMIIEQYKKHRKGLTKTPPEPKFDYYWECRSLLKDIKKVHISADKPLKLSNSASNCSVRSSGGSMEEIVQNYNCTGYKVPIIQYMWSMYEDKNLSPKTLYAREVPNVWEVQIKALEDPLSDVVDVVGLLEPLKVRVITKGSAYVQSYLEVLRKHVHDFLRQQAPLDPIGNPKIVSETLSQLVSKEKKLGITSFDKWISGDYSAATDNLNMNISRQCIRAICDAIGRPEDIGLLEKSLCETRLRYPRPRGAPKDFLEEDPIAPQRNGQLMGNPMSFPILCLVNLIGYRRSLEQHLGRKVDPLDLPVLVNGDDILFRGDQSFYERWRDNVSDIGFELSPGKCYVHKSVATINSQLFLESNEGEFQELRYTNPGLIYGGFGANKKSARLMPISGIFSEALEGAWCKDRMKRRLLSKYKPEARKATRNGYFNLFLPVSAGGIGCLPRFGMTYKVTERQKQIAWLLSKYQEDNPAVASKLTCSFKQRKRERNQAVGLVPSNSRFLRFRSTYDEENVELSCERVFDLPNGAQRLDPEYDPNDQWSHGRFHTPSGNQLEKLSRMYPEIPADLPFPIERRLCWSREDYRKSGIMDIDEVCQSLTTTSCNSSEFGSSVCDSESTIENVQSEVGSVCISRALSRLSLEESWIN